MSPQKRLKTSMSYQDLSSNSFKLGSPPTLQSGLSYVPAHLQQQPQQAQQAHQSQQAQSNSMMVRVGSETHFIPESQGNFFGMSRIPSAPYMQLMDQRSSQTADPHFLQVPVLGTCICPYAQLSCMCTAFLHTAGSLDMAYA